MRKRSSTIKSEKVEVPVKREVSDSEDDEPISKKARTSTASASVSASASTDAEQTVGRTDDGDQFITLGRDMRRVVVREFQGKTLVDIREYYKDKNSGDIKPGKKGISLSLEQWELLKANIATIDKMVKDK